MKNLKEKMSGPEYPRLKCLCTALTICGGLVQIGGKYSPVLVGAGLLLAFALIWLCDIQVKGFGLFFGVFLEHYAFQGEGIARWGMVAAAAVLYYVSLSVSTAKEKGNSRRQ